MSAWDRILLFLFSLLVTFCSIFALLSFAGFSVDYLPVMSQGTVIALIVLLLLISLRFLFYGFRKRNKSREIPAIVTHNEKGEIRISHETLESLVLRASRTVRGISDVKTRLKMSESGVRIAVRLTMEPDVEIPGTCLSVQEKVKSYVTSLSGVQVEDVIVSVQDIKKTQHHARELA